MLAEKERKFNIAIYILVFISVFIMLIGSSYAYFTKKIKNGDETRVIIKTANMLLRYTENNQINAKSISPGWGNTLSFSIENYSNDTAGKYKIKLEIISPLTESIENNFVYSLSGTSTTTNSDNVLINVEETPVPIETAIIGSGKISTLTLHNYVLSIKLKDNGQDQNYLKSKVFMAKIVVENDYS